MIKAMIFDMDGLIFDSERVVQRAWAEIGKEYGYPDLGENIYSTVGFNRARTEKYFRDVYGADFPVDGFNDRTRDIFTRIVDEEGLPLMEGAVEVLEAAKKKGIAIGLATSSSSEYAHNELKVAAIDKYFDGIVCGNMISHSKPDPEIYIKACKAVGVDPKDAIALEDAPAGVESAYRAGLRVIMVPDLVKPDEETKAKAWKIVDSLMDVLPIIEKE